MEEFGLNKYLEQSLSTYGTPKIARQPTLKERLTLVVEQAKIKLNDVKRAKEIFDKNPELEELLNIMQRGNF